MTNNKKYYPWIVVALLWGVALLNYMDRQMLSTMKSAMMIDITELESATNFGRLMAVFLWIYGLMSPVAGMIADRINRKWLIVGSLFVWSFVTLMMGYSTDFNQIYILRAIMGVSEALYIPAGLSLITDYHQEKTRSLAVGIHMTGLYTGQALGGFGATIAGAYSWETTFHWFGIIGIAYSLVLIFFLKEKKDGDIDTRDILTIKGLIRRGEARTACTYNNIPLEHCHFLDLPFYETGRIQTGTLTEAAVEIVRNLLREVKPHQIFVAGDLADPHGTHRVCTDAVFAAIDLEKEEGAKWLKDCRIWMYRGAWAEWEIENIEMAVPISPEELRAKRNSILKHQSQMESAPFLGNDERLFWQRSEDRNRGTAALYDSLGLASYEAMEAFVEYIPL